MPRVKSIKLSIICGAVLGGSLSVQTAFAKAPRRFPRARNAADELHASGH